MMAALCKYAQYTSSPIYYGDTHRQQEKASTVAVEVVHFDDFLLTFLNQALTN